MIYEIHKNKDDDSGFLGFVCIFDGIINKFGEILEKIIPDAPILINKLFEPETKLHVDWFSKLDYDVVNITDINTNEKIAIKEPFAVNTMILVAILHESQNAYISGNIDFAWKTLVSMSCALRDLSIKFDSISNDGMATNEIILLRSILSAAGKKGAEAKNQPQKQLKTWALEKAKTMHGSDMEISRQLATQVPEHLIDASNNHQRLIYDTLRAQHKHGKPASRNG